MSRDVASPSSSSANASLEVLCAGFEKATGETVDALVKAFLAEALEDYDADETPDIDLEDLGALLAEAWTTAAERKAGEPARIQVGPLHGAGGRATGFDRILIVQDDRPFLVDSVMGELAETGVSVRAMFHPIADVTRDGDGHRKAGDGQTRESVIIVVMDPLPQERRDSLGEGLSTTLTDVAAATADHKAMRALMARSVAHLEAHPAGVDPAVVAETVAFLNWLNDDHFVFLGARDYDYPRSADGGYEAEAPLSQSGEGLGVLRDPERTVLRRANEPAVLTRQMKRQLDLSDPVTVAKANARSRVHRRAYMDYIGVKRFGPDGRPSGETRFVGLFTAEAYDRVASQVPLIRRKVERAL